MSRIVARIAALLLFAGAVALVLVVQKATRIGPRVVVADRVSSLGAADPGDKLRPSWTLSNTGDADLHVTVAATSCHCTSPIPAVGEAVTVPPGESLTVSATVEVNAWKGGAIERTVTLQTDDPRSPDVLLRAAYVERPALAGDVPLGIHVPRMPPTGGGAYAFSFYATKVPDFEVTDVRSTIAAVTAEVRPATAEERAAIKPPPPAGHAAYRLIIRVPGPLPLGPFRGEVTFRTNAAHLASCHIDVSGDVQAATKAAARAPKPSPTEGRKSR